MHARLLPAYAPNPSQPYLLQGNAGRQSGAVYVHGHTDGVTPSLGCRLTLRRVEVARNAGYQAGAILAS